MHLDLNERGLTFNAVSSTKMPVSFVLGGPAFVQLLFSGYSVDRDPLGKKPRVPSARRPRLCAEHLSLTYRSTKSFQIIWGGL